ncbi:MAG: hypothetical protein D6690_02355 [Nitrospirae bacterium]|nr:MAG: hypothetical protein D6690_02355 [Nitrospirota bacterium]
MTTQWTNYPLVCRSGLARSRRFRDHLCCLEEKRQSNPSIQHEAVRGACRRTESSRFSDGEKIHEPKSSSPRLTAQKAVTCRGPRLCSQQRFCLKDGMPGVMVTISKPCLLNEQQCFVELLER